MAESKLVLITNASRQYLHFKEDGCAERVHYAYRKGDIGLLHQEVIGRFKNFRKSLNPTCSFAGPFCDSIPLYQHTQANIPVVFYQGDLCGGGSRKTGGTEGYFIGVFVEGEYTPLQGRNFDSLKSEIQEIYLAQGIAPYMSTEKSAQDLWEEVLDEQFRFLSCFDVLMKGKSHELAIEITTRDISNREIERRKRKLKAFEKLPRPGGPLPDYIIR